MVVLGLTVKVPRHLPLGITEPLEKGIAEAVQILAGSSALEDISESAYNLARLVVTQVRLGGIMLEERINCQMRSVKKEFEEGDWLTAEDINTLQRRPPAKKSLPAIDWKRSGRIFSVSYDGKEYFRRYQFNVMFQPLPVVRKILKAYGECADSWSLAKWFHFPNSWIANEVDSEAVPMAPKDALDRSNDVIKAARNQRGTYVA